MLYENQDFIGIIDRDSARTIAGAILRHCRFVGCVLSRAERPELRTTVQDLVVQDCVQSGSIIRSAVLKNIIIENTQVSPSLDIWGACCERVKLKGRFGLIKYLSLIDADKAGTSEQYAFDRANQEFYKSVDWALDISEAFANEIDIRGLPARLVRRDPETQVIVTRDRALSQDWHNLPFRCGSTMISLRLFLKRGEDEYVFAAGRRSREFEDELADLHLLRHTGIAEPD